MEALEQSKTKLKVALGLLEAKIHEQIKGIQALKQENKRLIAKSVELEAQLFALKQSPSKLDLDEKSIVNKSFELALEPMENVEMSINELKSMVSKK